MRKLLDDALMRLTRRAEASDPAKLIQAFVDAEPLLTLLFTTDHQVIYGRRGTVKTHALLYLFETEKRIWLSELLDCFSIRLAPCTTGDCVRLHG
jgi:hypothetical protein